jgi:hypothetical protein
LNIWDKLIKIFNEIPKVASNISKLSDNKELKDHLEKAGSIGGLINFSLIVIQQVRPYFVSKERIAFSQLLEILLFSSQQALPNNIKDLKISDVVDKEFTSGLFTYFVEDKWYPYMYASNNRIISRFKEQLRSILVENNLSNQDINALFISLDNLFADYLMKKRLQFKELEELLTRKESQAVVDEKIKFLQYTHDYKFHKFNEKDDKFLYEYYVENNAILIDSVYWTNEEHDIPRYGEYGEWNIHNFLYNQPENSDSRDYIVIGAPFGIGKSSFGRHIVSKLASEYLDSSLQQHHSNNDVEEISKYFPIFVPLKYDFFDVYNDKSFDDVLNILTNNGKFSDTKILCIFDGLDEYTNGVGEFYSRLSKYRQAYKGMKSIITTRLEAKYPQELHIYKDPQTERYRKYVRLFSFIYILLLWEENMINILAVKKGEKSFTRNVR